MSQGAFYLGKICIKELIVKNAHKEDFVNPYKPILGGTAFQIDKEVHITDL